MKIKTGVIVKIVLASLFIWYISYGIKRCHEEGDVVRLEFNEFNPQIYDLPFNIDSVENAIIALDADYSSSSYRISERNGFDFILDPAFYELSYVYVYRNRQWEPVLEAFLLSVNLLSLNKDLTRITVRKSYNSVSYGVKMWQDVTFKYYFYNVYEVKTPAIQEYDFIRLLGKQLGYLKNMPFTKYPKELSQKQILVRFGDNMPFTVDEVFEHPEEGLEEWYKQNCRNFRNL